MRLVRIASHEGPRIGVQQPDGTVDLFDRRASPDGSMRHMIERFGGIPASWPLPTEQPARLAPAATTLLAPIDDPRQLIAIGLNYRDHAVEAEQVLPADPLVFAKLPSSIVGPGDEITWDPAVTDAVDYEAELAAVIGVRCRDVPVDEALDVVLGYTCLNDISARDLQFGDGQWVRAKSLRTFCPIGPAIVTRDEISDPQRLAIGTEVNGEVLQDGTTADMIFSVAELVARLSSWFELFPGDIIATGTPPGVGWFRDPRRVLRSGDIVTVQIETVGPLVNPVRRHD